MPRQSVESKAGAAWRAAAKSPCIDPPSYLDKAAKSLWVSIVSSKPADWFDAGSYALLVEYCQITARHKKLVQELNELDGQKPTDPLERQILRTATGDLEERILKHAR